MKNLFLSSFSQTLNAYLKLDPASRDRIATLAGKSITLELLPLHLIFTCTFHAESGIIIHQESQTTPTLTKISGTPLQLMGVMLTKENRHRFFADDVKIEGDAELADQVIKLFDHMQIDWQEPLSRLIGDVPTHHLSRFMENIGKWVKNTDNAFTQDIKDYLHEEINWFPTSEALEDFFIQVDIFRLDVDRLEAKINYLKQKMSI